MNFIDGFMKERIIMKKVLLTVTALSGLGLASAMEIQPDMQDQQPKVIAHPGQRVDDAGFQWIGGGWVVHNFLFAERWGCGYGATGWCPQEKGTYNECQRFYAAHFVPALARYDNALAEWNRLQNSNTAQKENL